MAAVTSILFSYWLALLPCFVICDSIKPDCDPPGEQKHLETYPMKELSRHLILEEEDCGEVCDTPDRFRREPSKYFDKLNKFIDCDALFESPTLDRQALKYAELFHTGGDSFRPPVLSEIPENVAKKFGYHGRVPFYFLYIDNANWKESEVAPWTEELLENHMEVHKQGIMRGAYGVEATYNITQSLTEHMLDEIKDKHVLVIGSQSPWIEAILLNLGAAKITTLEYAKIETSHPKLEVVSIHDLRDAYKKGKLPTFDSVVTFSSLEHSGLGRYGDSLDPWGDLIAMGRAWCMTKPGGKALVGVPAGMDGIVFNSNRIYGQVMLPHLFANWKQIWSNYVEYSNGLHTSGKEVCGDSSENILYCAQPIFIVEKEDY